MQMLRRLAVTALVLSPIVLAACSNTSTAPKAGDDCSGWIDVSGKCVGP